jgi:hypothetical protein
MKLFKQEKTLYDENESLKYETNLENYIHHIQSLIDNQKEEISKVSPLHKNHDILCPFKDPTKTGSIFYY